MEQMLLNLNLETADDEELNGIFRCAHSVKGGAATFGFSDVAELTHQMESLLDRLRRHELQPNSAMVDVLLESADASRESVGPSSGRAEKAKHPRPADLVRRISDLAAGETCRLAPPCGCRHRWLPRGSCPGRCRPPRLHANGRAHAQLEIRMGPLDHLEQADAIKELFRDIAGLGEITESLSCDRRIRGCSRSRHHPPMRICWICLPFTCHVSRSTISDMGAATPAGGATWMDARRSSAWCTPGAGAGVWLF